MSEACECEVYFIASPFVDDVGVIAYLRTIGAAAWESNAASGDEYLMEVAGRVCFDEKTEYLTSNGWRKYNDLDGTELFATMNPNSKFLEYQKPRDFYVYRYKGFMAVVESRDISLCVTPEHRQYCKKRNSNVYDFFRTQDLLSEEFSVLCGAFGWRGFYPDHITISDYVYEQRTANQYGNYGNRINTSYGRVFSKKEEFIALAKLMVYYATEGHLVHGVGTGSGLVINGDHENGVVSCCNVLGLSWNVSEDSRNGVKHIKVNGGLSLMNFFKNECGEYSVNKKLPRWVGNLPVDILQDVWDLLVATDGSMVNRKHLVTTSRHLIDFSQEILVKLGLPSSVRKAGGTNYDCFNVFEKQARPIHVNKRDSGKITYDKYDGFVHCVSTNNGIVLVRRDNLVHFSGNCYKSFGVGLNANITRVRDDNEEYLRNIISSGHGRILEHVNCSFIFHNVSRVFTHEFITHKVGTTQSQESLRFVRLDELRVYVPDVVKKYHMEEYFMRKMNELEEWQREMLLMFRLDEKNFEEKKIISSAMRRLAPMGLCTTVMWTANLRAIRHILEQRTNIHAEEEIRKVFDRVGAIMQERYPVIFEDFTRHDNGEWIAKYQKV